MKKGLCWLLTLTLMVLSLCVYTPELKASAAETTTMTTSDVLKVMNHMLKGTDLDDRVSIFADFDGNAKINTSDARQMLQRIVTQNSVIELPGEAIRVSCINDKTSTDGTCTYYIKAPYTDTYTFKCSSAKAIEITRFGTAIASGTTSLTVNMAQGAVYTLVVKTRYSNTSFSLTVSAAENTVTLPYDTLEPEDVSDIPLSAISNAAVNSPSLKYVPREGGKYIYCNNPEQIPYSGLGKCFMRNENLTGDVFVTFEHSNKTGYSVYLGYQVKNTGTTDVFITITNVGYQASGSWYGQEAWYDFYNTSFDLPDDFYTSYGSVNSAYTDYLYKEYTPRVYQPTTYRLPAGQYMYVVGGTSSDAYNNINVDGTANQMVANSNCANAAVKFSVVGGSVTGSMYCYNRTSQVKANPSPTGYWTNDRYYLQYQGEANHHGVIDSRSKWIVHDNIGSGMLPVTFTNAYDTSSAEYRTPYSAYFNAARTHTRTTSWTTNINPQNHSVGVGTDMVKFSCTDINGNQVVIDNDHADGGGYAANTGNWMIEYQEHMTFVNQGKKPRKIHLNLTDHGSLLIMLRDTNTGEVLEQKMSIKNSSKTYTYTTVVDVPANTARQITLSYLLMPNSSGAVGHSLSIEAP